MSKTTFQPMVSVVLPVPANSSNSGNLLTSIDSVLAQSYSPIEILVVDQNKNRDFQDQISKRYGDKIRYFSQPGGFASALNFASRQISGDYFAWLMPGYVFFADTVERQIRALANMYRGRVIVYGDKDSNRLPGVRPDRFRFWLTTQTDLNDSSMLFPSGVFAECGLLNDRLEESTRNEYYFRLAGKFRFVHLSEILIESRASRIQTANQLALKEWDSIRTEFVQSLSMDEVILGCERSPIVGYSDLSSRLRKAGFPIAARAALKCAIRLATTSPIKDCVAAVMKVLMGLPIYELLTPLRKLVPNSLKARLKRTLLESRDVLVTQQASKHVREFGLKEKFSEIYDKNFFEGDESLSGNGSDLIQTAVIRRELPKLLAELRVETFLDAPCGDWFWMRKCDLAVKAYFGVDIVGPLIERNQQNYGNDSVRFQCLDLAIDKLPKADLVFSRDCLEHLSFSDAFRVLENMKRSGAKYLMTTTFTDRERNFDLGESVWRPLNKQIPPFNFPKPIRILNEHCTEGDGLFGDKCLGVWDLATLDLKPMRDA